MSQRATTLTIAILCLLLALALAASAALAQKLPGTGFQLRSDARVVRNGLTVNLDPACDMFVGQTNVPSGTSEELQLKRVCRYSGVVDREGLHADHATACLRWAFTDRPDHPAWNRSQPAAAYIGEPLSREREDAWMTNQGDELFAGCPFLPKGTSAVFPVTPERVTFSTTGHKEEQSTTLHIEAVPNQRWAIESIQPAKSAIGAVENRLRLDVQPRRGVGSTTLQVTLKTEPGVAVGEYTSSIRVSGGTMIKIDREVWITVGAGEPGLPLPVPTPAPTPIPSPTPVICPAGEECRPPCLMATPCPPAFVLPDACRPIAALRESADVIARNAFTAQRRRQRVADCIRAIERTFALRSE